MILFNASSSGKTSNMFNSNSKKSSWIENKGKFLNLLNKFKKVFEFVAIFFSIELAMNLVIYGWKTYFKNEIFHFDATKPILIPLFYAILFFSITGLYFFSGALDNRCRLYEEPLERFLASA